MKYLDTLLILAAAALFLILNETGYGDLPGRYCVIVFMIAYYLGKVVTKWQLQKTQDSGK